MTTNKFKFLSMALIFSGALNVGLVAALVYSGDEKTESSSSWTKKEEIVTTNGQVFNSMARLSFRELVSFLTNRDLVEEGYTKRDLALAALVAYHHFNLEKALSSSLGQARKLLISKEKTVDLYPGLAEEQFEAIIRFAYQEKWPLTAKGLFSLLQMQKPPRDESLEQAFLLTPEFYLLQLLFQKTASPQEPTALLNLCVEGSWDFLDHFFKEQSAVPEISEEKRRSLLLQYVTLGSPTAVQLLLRSDFTYAVKRLEDKQILSFLPLLEKPSEEGSRFCIELLRSPRSDAIWQAAAKTLYSYAGEMPALPIDPETVLARFSPSQKSKQKLEPSKVLPAPSRFHVVQEGESLWKISRQYKVKVDEIVQINGLEKDSLFPGMTLKLPQGTGSEPPG